MDPFSMTVGAVSLVDAANKVTTALIDRYQAFHSAPKQMQEIADQITLCAGLVDVFAKSVDGSGIGAKEFPEKFLGDAKRLVGQCHGILKEIERMIPRGSQKPGYTDRLRFAFGDEKKILKQQEKLKQVQHMLMFMTTCWMYQLPSIQKAEASSSSTANIPAGSFTGLMQHMPLQINIKDPNASAESTNYEATLTLKPINPQLIKFGSSTGKNKETKEKKESRGRLRSSAKQARNEKQVLENMRRSPYFCTSVLSQPVEAKTYSYAGGTETLGLERLKMEEAVQAENRAKKKQQDHYAEVVVNVDECLSSEQAAVGVDSILSEWFHKVDTDSSDIEIHHNSAQSPNTTSRSSKISPSPKSPTIEVVTVEPPSSSDSSSRPPSPIPTRTLHPSSSAQRPSNLDKSSLGRRHSNPDKPHLSKNSLPLRRSRSWDWKCDGCDLGYFNTDPRYKCMDCSNFDFCPHCYDGVWHRHPKSRFRQCAIYDR